MISASLDVYLLHIYKELGFDELICTEVATCNNLCTGELIRGNCRAINKVIFLNNLLECKTYELFAYGDSKGDKELLELADHSFFKPFQKI